MEYLIYVYTLLTITVFALAVKINRHWKSLIFNSFVLSVLFLIAILLLTGISYDHYMAGNAPLNHLLSLGVVALALPLYEQLPQIRKQWRAILLISLLATIVAMLSGAIVALLLGASPDIIATILPKSVTTPIAMEVADNIGGVVALTAVSVVIAGLIGSVFGYLILRKMRIKYLESIGLALGSTAHALGTATAMQEDVKAGSYSSLALVLCGIMSSLLAPLMFRVVCTLGF
ncbi:putative murein hydrolase (TIGR00659 family) [Volucribacter psittacicida]|uniref:Putative murein hydrolase (TIGR00659 family) n=1 Tax=Volucribacter psittacicida TaxID=203482 RepID=A0A4R1FX95_9PAST|nr:CidB/LrgB family autolysis modulator [Volucribacter psittacicida]TCJ98374.1 putative murein hydrolase (TIGR00659 family) [Volucribacter psittacicida]